MIDNIRYIARVFTQIGHSDKLGTGVRNVFKFFEPYLNSKKNVFNNDDIFIAEGSLKIFFDNTNLGHKIDLALLPQTFVLFYINKLRKRAITSVFDITPIL